MLCTSASPISVTLQRSGGAEVLLDVTVFQATPSGTNAVKFFDFSDIGAAAETKTAPLAAGSYICLIRSGVVFLLNGKYSFTLKVGSTSVYSKSGDVTDDPAAITSDGIVTRKFPNEQFMLTVTP